MTPQGNGAKQPPHQIAHDLGALDMGPPDDLLDDLRALLVGQGREVDVVNVGLMMR